jgi:pyridoxamine 5'-phosphate oxidase
MIEFNDLSQEEPFLIFKKKYKEAAMSGQQNIQAAAISSFNNESKEVDCRFVNIKSISNNNLIFFSNYNSPKSIAFDTHNQISIVFYWPSINVQIRMKAKIKKTTDEYNQKYFFDRSEEKNALAISSNQSKPIDSYNQVKENYNKSLKNDDLKKCPEFWGGYSFTPYYFEFWEGHESRLNKREVFKKNDDSWKHLILQP